MEKRPPSDESVGQRLKLRDLRLFFAVVESGSMAKTAVRLGVSQPAVSQVMADLERTFGVRLLDRSRKGVEPTIYGQALLKRGFVAIDELYQCVRDIRFLADPATGELKIGCPESLAGTVLPNFIEQFSKKYPQVAVHVSNIPTPAFKHPGLHNRQYDLMFARLAWPPSDTEVLEDMSIEYLFDDPLIFAVGAHNRLVARRRLDLAGLLDQPWILAPRDTWNYARVAEAFQLRGLATPKASIVSVSYPLIVRFLAHGPFISALPVLAAQLNFLKILPINLPARPFGVVIVTLKNRTLGPVVERFIACARDVAKQFSRNPRFVGKRAQGKLCLS